MTDGEAIVIVVYRAARAYLSQHDLEADEAALGACVKSWCNAQLVQALADAKQAMDCGMQEVALQTFHASFVLAGIEAAKECGFPRTPARPQPSQNMEVRTMQFDRSLTEGELHTLCRAAVRCRKPFLFALAFFYHRIAGREWPLQADLRATEYRIPVEQWKAICGAIQDGERRLQGNSLSGALMWMNYGPSASR